FFFQAEDGIRGRTVTGVQTCALPISWAAIPSLAPSSPRAELLSAHNLIWSAMRAPEKELLPRRRSVPVPFALKPAAEPPSLISRSEERRVGTECHAPRSAQVS